MTTPELIEMLTALSRDATDPPELARLNPESFAYRRALLTNVGSAGDFSALGSAVARELGWDPDQMISISDTPSGGSGLRVEHLGELLVARSRWQSPREVLESFFTLVEENAVEVTEVHILWGTHPAEPVLLGDGVELVALADVGPSLLRDRYLGVPEGLDQAFTDHPAVVPKPRAALVRRFVHGPVFGSSGGERSTTSELATERMLDVVRILTALLRRPIFPLAHGHVMDESTPLWLGGGWGGQAVYWPFQFEHAPERLDAAKLQSGVDAFLATDDRVREGLRTALERLRAAYIHPWFHERAMDLGIALEATLFAGDRSTYTGELAYRFKLRGTLLSGGSPAQRRSTAGLLARLYKLRSRVAHGGRSPHGNESEELDITAGLELCCELVEAMAAGGDVPDWDGLAMGWSGESASASASDVGTGYT